uniref:Secreted protein n=1 Tax=Achlya hypogyna TaxID=1202772 RepID=A0A0A7CNA3_ACHHY|nr:secreted protein [Achlya hypogyna]
MKLLATAAVLAAAVVQTEAHGRMVFPPHRGYIGRLPAFKDIPIDYSDNGLNAGGIGGTSGGKHGVCGDAYSGVREHETGGIYGLFPTLGAKAVGACFAPGATVDINVQITANHKGYFEFGLCKLNGKGDKETEECFQDLLQPNGEKQWQLPAGNDFFKMQYKLPAGVKCDGDSHCVLRWWYVGGNNPGVGINGQEQFWNCADIYISDSCGSSPTSSPTNHPSPAPSSAIPSPAPSKTPLTDKPTKKPSPTTKPTTQPTTKPSHKPTHAPKPSSKPAAGTKKAWEQCGGKDYTGSTECASGAVCVKQDEWYSQCVPKRLR